MAICDRCKRTYMAGEIETTATCPWCGKIMTAQIANAVSGFLASNYPSFIQVNSDSPDLISLQCKVCKDIIRLSIDVAKSISWSSFATGTLRGIVERHLVQCSTQKVNIQPRAIVAHNTDRIRRICLEQEDK